jgi:tryptophan halogenase
MKRKVIVVGGGAAGLISAITLIRTCPDVTVTVIRSSIMGHIMVGEGTFAATPRHFHDVLRIPRQEFYEQVNPTWKLGVRFLWGPRPYFDYPFNEQVDNQILPSTQEPWGYYCLDNWEISAVSVSGDHEKLPKSIGYHFENQPFTEFLERYLLSLGGELIDAKISSVQLNEKGINSVCLESGECYVADFFVDASGFHGELIHKQLGEPYISMRDHLFCDKAIVGGWERNEDEPIKLYTTAETMDSGWCWQIEHERIINRGYVYSSAYLSVEEAAAEFTRKNPKISEAKLRVVSFESRHIRRAWVKNVVAIGNACGFIEPLEATNIQVICVHALRFAQAFSAVEKINSKAIENFNQFVASQWENIRDFLALHYRFNTRLETPFWKMAVRDTPLGGLEEYVKLYQANGPCLFAGEESNMFGHDGYLAILLGMCVSWDNCAIR